MVPDEVADVGDVLGKKGGEVNGNKDLPECSCEMRILDIDAPAGFNLYWGLYGYELVGNPPAPTGFEFIGQGVNWYNGDEGIFVPFPSMFKPLEPSGGGCYRFLFFITGGEAAQDIVLSTEVRCSHGTFGGTTVYPQFVIPAEGSFVLEYRYFSCEVLIEGEAPPCPPEKASGISEG